MKFCFFLKLTTIVLFFSFTLQLNAQQRNCPSHEILLEQQQQDPKRTEKLRQIEEHTRNFINNPQQRDVDGIITIPIVVHVVYANATQNISDAQIQSQVTVLNDDFRRLNSDADGTWSQAADTEIEFCLATVDPSGNPTNGITRTSTNVNGFGTNDAVKFTSSGGIDAWATSDYLNIWVCNIGGGILGYAQFPGGNPATDGVVNGYQYFGTTGTATAPFNLGRTMTHEVGHYLNLRHIWGDGNCNADDFVTDTPTSDAPNYGCASSHVSCSSLDMVQNYMDYSDDGCMNIYTLGQKNRMRAIFDTGGARVSLLNSPACGGTSGPSCNDGIQNQGETGVDCGGPCNPCPVACTDNEIFLSISFDNYPEETSWTITNDAGVSVASGGTYGNQADGSTIVLDLCLVDGCYDFTINDSYGDGICCQFGNGSYSITDVNGNVLASGGDFGSSETTPLCLSVPTPTCNDGIQNQGETGIDCGGPCTACPTCDDGIQNQGETGIDCGGPCTPCVVPCTDNELVLNITFDDYPEETSWTLTTDTGVSIDAGGTYGNQPDGSTITLNLCVPDGCFDFTINDSFGDGICCQFGSGSYTLTDDLGNTLASGGNFNNSETTAFCLNGAPAPTCDDGIQNQGETEVDCGGPCAPCATNCVNVTINENDFENGWGIWNDGGADCVLSSVSAYANSGANSIRLVDNTNTSVATTDPLNLVGFEQVDIDFTFIAKSMENGEDFWLQISQDNGQWTTLASWARGTDFTNNVREFEIVSIPVGSLSSNTRFRFRCDASGNSDFIYIDDVIITGCTNGNSRNIENTQNEISGDVETMRVFPNPANKVLNIGFTTPEPTEATLQITDFSGKVVLIRELKSVAGEQLQTVNTAELSPGFYFANIITSKGMQTQKFVVVHNP